MRYQHTTPSIPESSPLFGAASQPTLPDPDGATFDPALDRDRLSRQHRLVWSVIQDGLWYTLAELSTITGCPEASVSARLRDFRKPKFGLHDVQRRRRTDGQFEYRLEGQADGE